MQEKIRAAQPAGSTTPLSQAQASALPSGAMSDSEEEEEEGEGAERDRSGHGDEDEEEAGESAAAQQQTLTEDYREEGVVLRNAKLKGPAAEPDPEDEDFIAQFDKMMSSSMQNRTSSTHVKSLDVAIPLHLRGKAPRLEQTEDGTTRMKVTLLSKRKDYKEKELAVPVATELAENMRKKQEVCGCGVCVLLT